MVKYKLHTLIRVFLGALAIGASSAGGPPLTEPSSPDLGGVMRGNRVVRASGKRRVRNSVDACWYVLVMYVFVMAEARFGVLGDAMEDIDEGRKWVGKPSAEAVAAVVVGLRVAEWEESSCDAIVFFCFGDPFF